MKTFFRRTKAIGLLLVFCTILFTTGCIKIEEDRIQIVFPVSGISLNKTATTLTVGASEQLTASVSPSNASSKDLSWSSSNANVVTVANGLITAVAAGTATITVSSVEDNNKTASCTVTVIPATQTSYGVSIGTFANGSVTANKTTATAGETITLTISPATGYELNAISAYKTGDATTPVVLSAPDALTRTFAMPEFGVTVIATFKKTLEQETKEELATVKPAIEGGTYTVAQATANTEADVRTWLVTTLNSLYNQTYNVQFR